MREHTINNLDNFIAGWYLDDTTICDDIIEWHNNTPLKGDGHSYAGASPFPVVNKFMKDSTDSFLNSAPILEKSYSVVLQKCLNEYMEKYVWCKKYNQFSIFEKINIQHYKPGGAYHQWHTERGGSAFPVTTRHLVFMTYLNNVDDAGETEFFHQKLKIKPEKGLTLIWPADWTFTHRGISSPSDDKYIVTGWWGFL